MIEPSQFSLSGSATFIACLASIAAKSTLLVGMAFLLDLVIGRRRVLVRSSLWNATLAALTVLPLAVWLMPPLSLSLAEPQTRTADDALAALSTGPTVQPHIAQPHFADDQTSCVSAASPPLDSKQNALSFASLLASWTLVGIYVSVSILMAVRFALSLRAVNALADAAEPVADGEWSRLLASWRKRLGVNRQVRLLASPDIAVPVQIGWLQPAIVLPQKLLFSRDETTLSAVLIHELGHVRRGDYGWNLLRQGLAAVYWPQPLVWLVGRQICQLRERACDELCVHWLGSRQAYRAQLVELAAEFFARRTVALLGIAMSKTTKLSRRLQWIDASSGRPNCVPSACARGAFVGMAFLLAAAVGATSVRNTAADEPQSDDDDQTEPLAIAPENIPPLPPGTRAPVALPFDPTGTTPVAVAPEGGRDDEAGKDDDDRRVLVIVEPVERHDFTVETSQPCTLSAFRTADVYARIPGDIKRMVVDLGDVVQKGQTLAELESDLIGPEVDQAESLLAESDAELQRAKASVNEAEANLAASKADVEKAEADLQAAEAKLNYRQKQHARVANLVKERQVEERLFDEQEEALAAAQAGQRAAKSMLESATRIVAKRDAEVASAQAALKLAAARVRVAKSRLAEVKKRSEFVNVVSPIDGVVVARDAQVGEYVGTSDKKTRICTIAGVDVLTAITQIPELDALAVGRGAAAQIRVNAFSGELLQGRVSRVAHNIDPGTRTMQVEIDLPNPKNQLLPGMSGAAAVALAVHRNVISVPQSAVWSVGGTSFVRTVADGRAVETPIETGKRSYDRVEVVSGLKEGEIVIVRLADPKQKQPDWSKRPRVEIAPLPRANSFWIDPVSKNQYSVGVQ